MESWPGLTVIPSSESCELFWAIFSFMYQSIPPAPSSFPGLLRGIWPPCQSQGWGICKFCTAPRPGICHSRGYSRPSDTHAVSYQNITTQRVLLEKTQIGSSVKDRNKLKRVVRVCSPFYACISSLLIKIT